MGEKNIGVYDIEDTLCDLPEIRAMLPESIKLKLKGKKKKPSMYEVCWNVPKKKIAEQWKFAVAQCLRQMGDERKRLNILAGKAVYYGGQRKEFYSVVDRVSLENSDIHASRVALLVDDVYDMFSRLSVEGALFDLSKTRAYLEDVADDLDIEARKLRVDCNSECCIQWKKNSLLMLLWWRYLAGVVAENTALNLGDKGVDFMVWGVKQRMDSFVKWLNGSKPVYVSHPISEPRRHRLRDPNRKSFEREINTIQKDMLTRQMVAVMPTAIDEYRFGREPLEKKASKRLTLVQIPRWTGRLKKRWPLPAGRKELLWSPPRSTTDPDYQDLLLPRYWNHETKDLKRKEGKPSTVVRQKIHDLVEDLSEQVRFQISSRDHLIVSHAKGLVVYRPHWLGRKDLSSGVQAELEHWSKIASEESRCAFVHFGSDVIPYVQARASKEDLKNAVREVLREEYGVDLGEALKIIAQRKTGGHQLRY